MRRTWMSVFCLLMILAPAHAQNEAIRVVEKHLDESTFLVARVDIANINVAVLAERLAKVSAEMANAKEEMASLHRALIDAGVKTIHFTARGMPDRDNMVGIVPLSQTANVDKIEAILKSDATVKTRRDGDQLLFGSAKALAAAGKLNGKASGEWAAALARAEKSPSYIVVIPPRSLVRAAEELMPNLPKELGGGSTTELARAFRFAVIGADLSDKLGLEIAVQAKDADGAKRIDDVIGKALSATAKEFTPLVPNIDLPLIAKSLERIRPRPTDDQLRASLDAQAIDAALTPLIAQARANAGGRVGINYLKQIALAFHSHHDAYGSFPAAASSGKDKKPLLSWRVRILPFIEEEGLHQRFKLDEPWDSEHNKKLIAEMPAIFQSPLSKSKRSEGKTTYVVPTGPKLFFDGIKTGRFNQITDGTSNTIMVIDVPDDKAVIWTKPDDCPIDVNDAKKGLFREGAKTIPAAFFDGSVRLIPSRIPASTMWLYFCPNDGKAIPEEDR